MPDNGRLAGLGDIEPKGVDPLETYFDTVQQGVALPRRRWIVSPEWQPCKVESADPLVRKLIEAQQQMLECHTLPRMWQTLMDFWVKLQCGTYFTKNEPWLKPPVTAAPVEILATSGLGTAVTAAPGVDVVVASYEVPDRIVGSLLSFGNNINDATQLGNIQWNIKKANAPYFGYAGFFGSLGSVADPRPLASHIPIKFGDVIEVTARKIAAGPDVTAFCRLQGFSFPAPKISQTGDFAHFHTI